MSEEGGCRPLFQGIANMTERTYKSCPFCGEMVRLIKERHEWFFICDSAHRFQFEGMDEETLPMDVLEDAINEFNRRVTE